jgi:hypothetical protein
MASTPPGPFERCAPGSADHRLLDPQDEDGSGNHCGQPAEWVGPRTGLGALRAAFTLCYAFAAASR